MGAKSSKPDNQTETINWNNINTNNISSTMPQYNGISNEAKKLVSSLNIPNVSEVSPENTINHVLNTINNNLNKDNKKKFYKIVDDIGQSDNLSNTSPFISSEMYDYLVKSKKSVQQGGNVRKVKNNAKQSKKYNAKKISDDDDNDSSTSDTSSINDDSSSSDSDSSELKNKEKGKGKGKDKKGKKQNKNNSISENDLSYLSSSSHNGFQNKKSNAHPESDSVTDENKQNSTSISVRTEDINMISN